MKEKLKTALKKDFDKLLVKEFTTNWKVERFQIGLFINVMGLDNTIKLFDELKKK